MLLKPDFKVTSAQERCCSREKWPTRRTKITACILFVKAALHGIVDGDVLYVAYADVTPALT